MINDFKAVSGGDQPGDQCQRGSLWTLMSTAGGSQVRTLNQDFEQHLRAVETGRWGMQSAPMWNPMGSLGSKCLWPPGTCQCEDSIALRNYRAKMG